MAAHKTKTAKGRDDVGKAKDNLRKQTRRAADRALADQENKLEGDLNDAMAAQGRVRLVAHANKIRKPRDDVGKGKDNSRARSRRGDIFASLTREGRAAWSAMTTEEKTAWSKGRMYMIIGTERLAAMTPGEWANRDKSKEGMIKPKGDRRERAESGVLSGHDVRGEGGLGQGTCSCTQEMGGQFQAETGKKGHGLVALEDEADAREGCDGGAGGGECGEGERRRRRQWSDVGEYAGSLGGVRRGWYG